VRGGLDADAVGWVGHREGGDDDGAVVFGKIIFWEVVFGVLFNGEVVFLAFGPDDLVVQC
jgi:hypothetical protein